MRVETAELRKIAGMLLDHLEKSGVRAVEVPWDYYWDMPDEELYNPHDKPVNLDVGQLSDDWLELGRIGTGEMPPVGQALVWLSSILRAVGQLAPV